MTKRALLVMFIACACSFVRADQVSLRDGSIIKGTVTERNTSFVRIRTADGVIHTYNAGLLKKISISPDKTNPGKAASPAFTAKQAVKAAKPAAAKPPVTSKALDPYKEVLNAEPEAVYPVAKQEPVQLESSGSGNRIGAEKPSRIDFFNGGRIVEEDRDSRFSLTVGQVMDINAMVEETTRQYYDASGQSWKQSMAERYDMNDFGMDESYLSVGLEWEVDWKWWTFMLDGLVMQPSVDTVARRNYYIGVGDKVTYNGVGYERMQIPEGTPFTMDITALQMDAMFLFTPCTIAPSESVRFTPWIGLGLMFFVGFYDIDAGDPQGVVQYMNPPEDFVVGGQSSGMVGIALPEAAIGGEFRFGRINASQLVLQGNIAVLSYDGSTKFLTSSSHREKNADIDHKNYMVRLLWENKLKSGRVLTMGLEYKLIDTEGMITSTASSDEEALAARERFDKNVEFSMSYVSVLAGLAF